MPTLNNHDNFGLPVQDDAGSCMNDSGTGREIDTPVTQGRSLVVLPVESLHNTGFGMENARRYFMAQRLIDGADTPIGHRWSNLIEIVQSQRLAETREQVETLFMAFAKNFIQIADLKRGRPMRKLSPPQLLLAYQTNTFH